MPSKILIIGTIFAVLVSLVSFLGIVLYMDPEVAGIAGVFLFYTTLFLWLAGAMFLGGVYFKKRKNDAIGSFELGNIFRQSIFLSIILVSFLALRQFNLLNVISGIFIIIFTSFLELYIYKMRK